MVVQTAKQLQHPQTRQCYATGCTTIHAPCRSSWAAGRAWGRCQECSQSLYGTIGHLDTA
eukprot:1136489-Pelagomonas_calceolata.AAC.3